MQVMSVAVGMAVLDQVSKAIIRHQMTLHESIPVFSDFFHITYILNRGAAFGVLENQQWLFLLIAFFCLSYMVCFVLNYLRHGCYM